MEYSITVVTIVKNDFIGLQETTQSILNLALKMPELSIRHLIMDGNSSDALLDRWQQLISKFSGRNYHGVFSSENDNGIYDAMNKASRFFEEDDIVWYLNAGDIVNENIDSKRFQIVINDFKSSRSVLLFCVAKCKWRTYEWHMPPAIVDSSNFGLWITGNTPVHQAVLFKYKSALPLHYLRVFKIQADTILIYYIIKSGSSYMFSDEIICIFYLGGLSGSYLSARKVLRQTIEQYFVYALRGDRFHKYFSLPLIMFIKYLLNNIFGSRFYNIHSIVNRMRFK
jgi:hypothetical protein